MIKKSLLDRVKKDPEAVFEFKKLKSLLSQTKSSSFLNNPLSNGTTHIYHNIVLLDFTQA